MLEFIVLGQIPGTHYQITFKWTMLIIAIMLGLFELRYHALINRRRNDSEEEPIDLNLVAL